MQSSSKAVKREKILAHFSRAVKPSIRTSRKGFKYHGTHWTQQPENKKKLTAMVRKNWRKRQKG